MSNDKKIVVVTAADYYLGHHTAHLLLERESLRKTFDRLVITAVHPERCDDLKKRGAHVVKIDPNNTSSYEEAFRDASWVKFFLEPEAGRVQSANRAIDAMKKVGAKNIIMMSCASAESSEHKYLNEFKEVEDKLRNTLNDYVIFRNLLYQQWFHLHGPYVQRNHTLPMTLSKEAKFPPVNLDDVLEACGAICRDGMEKHRSKTYTLTGPEDMTGPQIAQELTKSVDSKTEIQYQRVSREELAKYFRDIRDRIGEDSDSDRDLLRREFMGQPTDHQIQTIFDELDWVEKGRAKRTEDLQNLIGRKGQRIDRFFAGHKTEFRSGRA